MKSVVIDKSRFRDAFVWCSNNIDGRVGSSSSDIEFADRTWAFNPRFEISQKEIMFKNDEDAFRFVMEFV